MYIAEYFLMIFLMAELELILEEKQLNFEVLYSKYAFFKTTKYPYKYWILNSYEFKIGLFFTAIIFLFFIFVLISKDLSIYILLFFINLILLVWYIIKIYIFIHYKSFEFRKKINHFFLIIFVIYVIIIFLIPDMYNNIFLKISFYNKIYGEFFKLAFLVFLYIFNIHKLISFYVLKLRKR
ncbi:hypothetical protein [Marinitoga sp. 1197]|uniref:hypothetical protein n=1 Tax=Marinitoga sp. 1197 TaxID=1428449 RepID=UPI0018CCE41C|nr:hypothetical protein [Marinitoga sp. 1197]